MTIWRRCLLVGLAVSALCVALPLGVGRDLLYCFVGASSVTAILIGVRKNRPHHAIPWSVRNPLDPGLVDNMWSALRAMAYGYGQAHSSSRSPRARRWWTPDARSTPAAPLLGLA